MLLSYKNRFKECLKRNFPVIVAFIMPIVLFLIIFAVRNIAPFGSNYLTQCDGYVQYYPFMTAFQRALQEGNSLSFMWELGLGTNFAPTYAYYLASPINWLIALFPASATLQVMDAFIVLKSGLMGATFCYYLIKKFGKRTYLATIVSVFYALSSYTLAYGWNLMWLDALVLLPLIMMGLESLVREGRAMMYTITLCIAVLSNYYMGIILCIFMVVYFIYLLIIEGERPDGIRRTAWDIIKTILKFGWFSILAGLMSMAVIMPVLFSFSSTESAGLVNVGCYFLNNFLEVFSQGVMGTQMSNLGSSTMLPYIYSTTAMFLLIPLFFINKDISLKRRIGFTILLAFMLFSMNVSVLTYVWHGLHVPHGMPHRESFIFILLTLVAAYETLIKIKSCKQIAIVIAGGVGIAACALFYFLYNDEDFTLFMCGETAFFIILYGIVFLVLNDNDDKEEGNARKKRIAMLLFTILCCVDVVINTAYLGYTNEVDSVFEKEDIQTLLEDTEDDSFYRVRNNLEIALNNEGTLFDYKGATCFNSTIPAAITDLYADFGMGSSTNAYLNLGGSPFTEMLLGVKYDVLGYETDDSLKEYLSETSFGNLSQGLYLYRNKYALNLGYTIPCDNLYDTESSEEHPLEFQNCLAETMCNIDGLFFRNYTLAWSDIYTGVVSKSGRGFVYMTEIQKESSIMVEIIRNGEPIYSENINMLCHSVVDIGDVEKGDLIRITYLPTEEYDTDKFTVSLYTMDYDKMEQVYNVLSQDQFEITEYGDTYVKGSVVIKDGKELVTTIPYDTGWTVYIDGNRAEYVEEKDIPSSVNTYSKYLGTFISVQMEPGEHVVEFVYEVPGQKIGFVAAGAGLVLFIISLLVQYLLRKKELKEKGNSDAC